MAKPTKPSTPKAAKGTRTHSPDTFRNAVAKDIAAFKLAARKAALADADEIGKRYEAASKKIAATTEKLLKAAAGKSLDDADGGKLKAAKAEIAALKSAAVRALTQGASGSIGALLNDKAFTAHDADAKPPKADGGKTRPDHADNFDDNHIDGADEH